MLIILICVGIISLSSNIFFEKQFRNYIIHQQEQDATNIVSLINQQINESSSVDAQFLNDISMNALEKGMIIKIKDNADAMIWDTSALNSSMCQQMISDMQTNMQTYYSEDEGGYTEKSYALLKDDAVVGAVIVGYYGPYFYTDSDLYFIKAINNLLILSGVISLILALILGILMSKQLTKPIRRMIKRTEKIANGQFEEKSDIQTNTKEIVHLSETIDNLADALQKQQNFSRQASSDIAHELRTPLTTIQGNLEGIMDGVLELDNHRIEILHDEVLRINRLVDDLGKLAWYERESFVLNKESFDIAKLLSQVIESFEHDFIKQNKTILFVGLPIMIYADRDKISQVIVNLISNASKFTHQCDVVEVMVDKKRESVVIRVKDSGIGISDEDLPHIFERFYRSDKSRSRISGGSGIGLTIVKSIVSSHGGTISVINTNFKGCEFIITLPIN